MKTRKLIIIYILFLLIASVGVAVFLKIEKSNQPIVNERPGVVEKQAELALDQPTVVATSTNQEKNVQPEKTEQPPIVSAPTEEKIKVEMMINGVKYEATVKPGDSAYDLMNELKNENKIDFQGKNYSGLGFFVEEINGIKNNPAGENWIYYVNGQPAQVGVSYYLIKENDVIEWKYEKSNF